MRQEVDPLISETQVPQQPLDDVGLLKNGIVMGPLFKKQSKRAAPVRATSYTSILLVTESWNITVQVLLNSPPGSSSLTKFSAWTQLSTSVRGQMQKRETSPGLTANNSDSSPGSC